MKLLFDANLSPKLVRSFDSDFRGSLHVLSCGQIVLDDILIWQFARKNDFVIVSKDGDFSQLSFLFGQPPKVIWLRVGNCPTRAIEATLRMNFLQIERFGYDTEAALLIVDG